MVSRNLKDFSKTIFFSILILISGRSLANTAATQFIEQMRAKLQPKSSSTLVNQFTRVCGEMRIVNEKGKEILVRFAGSTHEQDVEIVEIDGKDDFKIKVTTEEFKFLKNCLKPDNKRCDLLVEQGDVKAEGNFLTKINRLPISSEGRKKLKIDLLATYTDRHKSEMDEMSRLFRKHGKNVSNFDLVENANALDYIYKNKGINEVLQSIEAGMRRFFEIKNPQNQFPDDLSKLGEMLIQSSSLKGKIKKDEFANWVKNPNRKLDVLTDSDREAFMFYETRQQNQEVCVLAHSVHITNLVEKFLPNIKEFKILSTELGRDGKPAPAGLKMPPNSTQENSTR